MKDKRFQLPVLLCLAFLVFFPLSGLRKSHFLDDLSFVQAGVPPSTIPPAVTGPTLAVNAAEGQHPIRKSFLFMPPGGVREAH